MSTLAEIEALLFVAGENGIRGVSSVKLNSLPADRHPTGLEKLAQKYRKRPGVELVPDLRQGSMNW